MLPSRVYQRLRARILAWIALRSGIYLYRRGDLGRAAEVLRHALRISGPSFACHLHLGKIYLRTGQFDRAREEFARARFLDPRRFAAEGLPEDILIEMAQRYALQSHRNGAPMPWPAFGSLRSAPSHTLTGTHDDFLDDQERARFRHLPPISSDAIHQLDWAEAIHLFD